MTSLPSNHKGTCRVCDQPVTLKDGAWQHRDLTGFIAHVKHGLWEAVTKTQDDFALAGPSKGGSK